MSGTMDDIARACPVCRAELGPDERHCPRCGQPAPARAPDTVVVPGMRPAAPGLVPPGPRQPPRRHDRPRSGPSVAPWVVLLVLLACGGAAALLLANPFGHHSASTAAGTAAPSATASVRPAASVTASGAASGAASASASAAASGSPSAPATEQQAAKGVAALLARSAADRTAITSAASDVSACGADLAADLQTFGNSATSRKAMLASLDSLPGRARLPATLLSELAGAWQASIVADQAYGRWASDELAKTCVPRDTSDPGYQATVGPNATATQDKTAFVDGWNAIAARYGLTQYQQGQL